MVYFDGTAVCPACGHLLDEFEDEFSAGWQCPNLKCLSTFDREEDIQRVQNREKEEEE